MNQKLRPADVCLVEFPMVEDFQRAPVADRESRSPALGGWPVVHADLDRPVSFLDLSDHVDARSAHERILVYELPGRAPSDSAEVGAQALQQGTLVDEFVEK